jgi:hypothetical protein
MSNGYKTAHLVDEFGSYAVLYLPGFIPKKTWAGNPVARWQFHKLHPSMESYQQNQSLTRHMFG